MSAQPTIVSHYVGAFIIYVAFSVFASFVNVWFGDNIYQAIRDGFYGVAIYAVLVMSCYLGARLMGAPI